MAVYFRSMAETFADDRRGPCLTRAAVGYEEVAKQLHALIDLMPEKASGDWSAEDLARAQRLPETLDMWTAARRGERDAFTALSEMLGAGPLPPIRTDPLERRDRGRKLATWRADLSRGIFYLTLRGSEMHFEHIYGRQPEGPASAVLSAIDHDETLEVAIERVDGKGLYDVTQQPTAANGWATQIRINDINSWQSGTDLILWAVPRQ